MRESINNVEMSSQEDNLSNSNRDRQHETNYKDITQSTKQE